MIHLQVKSRPNKLKGKAVSAVIGIAAGLLVAMLATSQAAEATSPRFSAYPATETFRGTPRSPQLKGLTIRRAYRPIIRQEAKRGPNFAGAYTVVTYGCGTGCLAVLVISARTGEVFTAPAAASYGVSFRRKSRLLVINADPVYLVKAQYFEFRRGKFRPVR